MSSESLELNRRYIAAFNARDVEAFVACCDPEIEFHSVWVGGAVYNGAEGLRQLHRDLEDAWGSDIRLEPEVYYDLGQDTLGFYVLHGQGRHSGLPVAMPMAHLVTWRDGLAVYAKSYTERADALEQLGLAANDLAPIKP